MEQKIHELSKLLMQARVQDWYTRELFSFQWWLQVILLIVPWFLWFRFVDKKKIKANLLVGLLTSLIYSYLDEGLSRCGYWSYDYALLPMYPRQVMVDITLVPIFSMLLYQYWPRWKSYGFAVVILSGIMAFILEPALLLLKIYQLHSWKHYYSFPIYIVIFFIIKAAVDWICKLEGCA